MRLHEAEQRLLDDEALLETQLLGEAIELLLVAAEMIAETCALRVLMRRNGPLFQG